MFKFKPSANGSDNTQFKFVKPTGWTTANDPANAIVISGSISETNEDTTFIDSENNVIHTNSIKYDYIKYISNELFSNWRLYTLFDNSNDVIENIANKTSGILASGELYKRFNVLHSLGTLDDTISINNPSRSILMQILKNDIERLNTLSIGNNEWVSVPIQAGDYIAWNITITPSSTQTFVNDSVTINPRKYLVKVRVVEN
jgi:hypothetical protein